MYAAGTNLSSTFVPSFSFQFIHRTDFSPQDLLAAIQAQMIYMIMRFVDGAPEPADLNQQMLVTYHVSLT